MNKYVIGIYAHVDSGKTTLAEALLYLNGAIRKKGRVDNRDTFLDNSEIERKRGITVFSHQAVFDLNGDSFTLLDTPGHIDFSAEAERTASVLDCAVLVISGTDGVQNHTETLWQLLKKHNVPVFVFINKTDIMSITPSEHMEMLRQKLGEGFVSFTNHSDDFYEQAAMCSDTALDEYLSSGTLSRDTIKQMFNNRQIFPCCFGSALKLDGIEELCQTISLYTSAKSADKAFGAKVFKITNDASTRLSHIKITGGELKVKDTINGEKVNEIRIYNGKKFVCRDSAAQGVVCAVAGLSKTYAGQGLGAQGDDIADMLEPIFTYRIQGDCDTQKLISAMRILEQEDPKLNVVINPSNNEITVCLMGEVQTEILTSIIKDRFGINAWFSRGSIAYKETITEPVIGAGHYEPLRHYAEVQLLLKPQRRGSGLSFVSSCPEDILDKSKQNLILSHLREKTHLGVLTGSPITDIKIVLTAGRAHAKHTEGGDFRQATYRAVRQGLFHAKSILLEPWFDFTLTVPTECVGRAMTDIQNLNGSFLPPESLGDRTVLKGSAPAAKIQDYQKEIIAYTAGKGSISCIFNGYRECYNSDEVIAEIGYSAESDLENTADSVFCSHGAGTTIKWSEADEHMHIPVNRSTENDLSSPVNPQRVKKYIDSIATDKELMEIFERTYGPIKNISYSSMYPKKQSNQDKQKSKPQQKFNGENYLLIDGYNVIFAWDDLKELAEKSLDLARNTFINIVCNYQGFKSGNTIIVFDAYKVKGGVGSVEKIHNINVVYTKEAETADSYIERVTHEIGKNNRVRVVTSDRLEQLIVLGGGAVRVSAESFREEVKATEKEIKEFLFKSPSL